MTEDKVSIIIPVYNAAKHLDKCLNSVVKQTYCNIEIIIINDGSTDNSKEVCECFVSKYKNIKLINQENCGPSSARNKGIQVSSGKYIQFVDSDDTIDLGMTEKLVDSINDEIQFIICGYRYIRLDAVKEKIINRVPGLCGIKEIKDFISHFGLYFKDGFIHSPSNKLYASNVIKKNDIYFDSNVRFGEDLLFNLDYIKRCNKICVIQDVLYNYVACQTGSLTSCYKNNLFQNQKMLNENVKKFLLEKGSLNIQNQTNVDSMYYISLLTCFENVIYSESSLKFKQKMNEINYIVNDESINVIIKNMYNKKLQFHDEIVRTLINHNAIFGIFAFFSMKRFIRNNLSSISRVINKINLAGTVG
jgi:glycosyltransferase involved in cell wall biosynthesis